MSGTCLLVVDCQHDFIDGTLACGGAEEAVEAIAAFINEHPEMPVLYSADWHSPQNRSFARNGGTWPPHCVAGERGAEVHEKFRTEVRKKEQRPGEATLYLKGKDDFVEEYSAFEAKNALGGTVASDAAENVAVCGIASEYCVRETVLDLLKAGRNVTLLTDALGWVDRKKHEENLKDLEGRGVRLKRTEEEREK